MKKNPNKQQHNKQSWLSVVEDTNNLLLVLYYSKGQSSSLFIKLS